MSKDYYQTRLCPHCLKAKLYEVQEMPEPEVTIVRCDSCHWKGKLMSAAVKGK